MTYVESQYTSMEAGVPCNMTLQNGSCLTNMGPGTPYRDLYLQGWNLNLEE